MVTAKPKFSQQTFDHMRRLIHKMKNRASTQNDSETYGHAELLDALLLRFVEDLIMEGSLTVPPSPGQSVWFAPHSE
jgi:hypothetical protein